MLDSNPRTPVYIFFDNLLIFATFSLTAALTSLPSILINNTGTQKDAQHLISRTVQISNNACSMEDGRLLQFLQNLKVVFQSKL